MADDREVCDKCGKPAKVYANDEAIRYLVCQCGALRGKQVIFRTVGVFIRLPGHPKRLRQGFIGDRKKRKR